MISDIPSHAHNYSHNIWNIVDVAAVVGGLSSPLWWQSFDTLGQAVILALTIAGAALRFALLVREWKRGK